MEGSSLDVTHLIIVVARMLSSHIIKALNLSDNESNINIDKHFLNGTPQEGWLGGWDL